MKTWRYYLHGKLIAELDTDQAVEVNVGGGRVILNGREYGVNGWDRTTDTIRSVYLFGPLDSAG